MANRDFRLPDQPRFEPPHAFASSLAYKRPGPVELRNQTRNDRGGSSCRVASVFSSNLDDSESDVGMGRSAPGAGM